MVVMESTLKQAERQIVSILESRDLSSVTVELFRNAVGTGLFHPALEGEFFPNVEEDIAALNADPANPELQYKLAGRFLQINQSEQVVRGVAAFHEQLDTETNIAQRELLEHLQQDPILPIPVELFVRSLKQEVPNENIELFRQAYAQKAVGSQLLTLFIFGPGVLGESYGLGGQIRNLAMKNVPKYLTDADSDSLNRALENLDDLLDY